MLACPLLNGLGNGSGLSPASLRLGDHKRPAAERAPPDGTRVGCGVSVFCGVDAGVPLPFDLGGTLGREEAPEGGAGVEPSLELWLSLACLLFAFRTFGADPLSGVRGDT
jgi:hypothetical protein